MNLKPSLFSIIIVAYNAGNYLSDCVEALNSQNFKDFDVLILDNASTDGAVDRLNHCSPNIRVISLKDNLGFARAVNLGVKNTRSPWIVFLNPDAIPEIDWLTNIFHAVRQYRTTVMFGSTQLRADKPETLDGAGDHYHPFGLAWRGGAGDPADTIQADAEVFGPCGAAAIYRRDVFEREGGFEESFFCYYEDVDLALRLRLSGELCIQLAHAKVRHVGSASTKKDSDFVRYHVTRNRIWTFFRGLPGPLLLIFLPGLIFTILLRILISAWTGDFSVRVKAIYHAIKKLPKVLKDRKVIQSRRQVSIMEFARALTWSTGKLILQSRDARAVPLDQVFNHNLPSDH